jgi:hypothetical protein
MGWTVFQKLLSFQWRLWLPIVHPLPERRGVSSSLATTWDMGKENNSVPSASQADIVKSDQACPSSPELWDFSSPATARA